MVFDIDTQNPCRRFFFLCGGGVGIDGGDGVEPISWGNTKEEEGMDEGIDTLLGGNQAQAGSKESTLLERHHHHHHHYHHDYTTLMSHR